MLIEAAFVNCTELFFRHLPENRRQPVASLEPQLTSMLDEARTALEGIGFEDEWLLGRLAACLPEGPIGDALQQVRAADVALAGLCAEGNERAIARVNARYRGDLRRALEQRGFGDVAEDVVQQALTRALVGPEADIKRYAGRGSLGRWLQTLAVRTALNLRRGRKREELHENDRLFERATEAAGAETAHLEALYRGQLKRAFQRAFARLGARERNVLRYLYLDGLNIDDIGRIYGVHRATVARWRAHARELLNRETRSLLASEHGLSANEVDSIVHLVDSQMEVSLSRILSNREQDVEEEP